MSYFIRNANTFRVASEESLDLHKSLPVGNYTVKYNDMTDNYFLEMVDEFPKVKKLYGDTTKNANRILATFNDRPASTGVMLNGEKGSGKTLLAKTISQLAAEQGIPTLIINQSWTGDTFNKFLQDIEQPTVILFDEFEKVYDERDQEAALTLLDGVFPSKKLFVITCNNKWRVNEHMRNRPGRIYYLLDFVGLDPAFIREYCEENLKAKQHIDKICEIAALFDQFNFDMLKAVVEEMNRYDETPQQVMRILNTKPEYSQHQEFEVELFHKDILVKTDKVWEGNPLMHEISLEWYGVEEEEDTPKPTSLGEIRCANEWIFVKFTPNNIVKVDAVNGKFLYDITDYKLILSRKKSTNYNYLAF